MYLYFGFDFDRNGIYFLCSLEKVNINYLIIFSAFEYCAVCFSLEMVKRCDRWSCGRDFVWCG